MQGYQGHIPEMLLLLHLALLYLQTSRLGPVSQELLFAEELPSTVHQSGAGVPSNIEIYII